jgi:hypothetical protein
LKSFLQLKNLEKFLEMILKHLALSQHSGIAEPPRTHAAGTYGRARRDLFAVAQC